VRDYYDHHHHHRRHARPTHARSTHAHRNYHYHYHHHTIDSCVCHVSCFTFRVWPFTSRAVVVVPPVRTYRRLRRVGGGDGRPARHHVSIGGTRADASSRSGEQPGVPAVRTDLRAAAGSRTGWYGNEHGDEHGHGHAAARCDLGPNGRSYADSGTAGTGIRQRLWVRLWSSIAVRSGHAVVPANAVSVTAVTADGWWSSRRRDGRFVRQHGRWVGHGWFGHDHGHGCGALAVNAGHVVVIVIVVHARDAAGTAGAVLRSANIPTSSATAAATTTTTAAAAAVTGHTADGKCDESDVSTATAATTSPAATDGQLCRYGRVGV
jgi:hypothetical protein